MAVLHRLRCRLFGHADTRLQWGRWQGHPESGRFRLVTERCDRCGTVLAVSSVLWHEWHRERAG